MDEHVDKASSEVSRNQEYSNGSAGSQGTTSAIQRHPSMTDNIPPSLGNGMASSNNGQPDTKTNPYSLPNPYPTMIAAQQRSSGSTSTTFGASNNLADRGVPSTNTSLGGGSSVKNDYNMGNGGSYNGQLSSQPHASHLNFQTGRAFELRPPHGALATRRERLGQEYGKVTDWDGYAVSSQNESLQYMSLARNYGQPNKPSPPNRYGPTPAVGQGFNQQPLPQANGQGMGPSHFDFTSYPSDQSATNGTVSSSRGSSQPSPFLQNLQARNLNGNGSEAVNNRSNLAQAAQNQGRVKFGRGSGMNVVNAPADLFVWDSPAADFDLSGQNNGFGFGDVNNYQAAPIPIITRPYRIGRMPEPPQVGDYEFAPHLGILALKSYGRQLEEFGMLLQHHATILQSVESVAAHTGGRLVWSTDSTFSATIEMPGSAENATLLENGTLTGNVASRNQIMARQFGTLQNAVPNQDAGLPVSDQQQDNISGQTRHQGIGQYAIPLRYASVTVFDAMANMLQLRVKGVLNGNIGPMPMPADARMGFGDDTPADTPVRGSTGRGRGRGSSRGVAGRGGGSAAAKKRAPAKRKATAPQQLNDEDEDTMGIETGSSAAKPPKKAPVARKRGPNKKFKTEAVAEQNKNIPATPPAFVNNGGYETTVVDAPEREVDNGYPVYPFGFEDRLISKTD
ncbi:hypothetical protein BKA65DRAFT_597400 [Rhexocercosporidium sp. MPI-PUGE-AT-0058]|nr:hypothetical protein BKA65DRAFT_597400 [Rhexocercosporidium sp. MPI-PUGE-AT-0058]